MSIIYAETPVSQSTVKVVNVIVSQGHDEVDPLHGLCGRHDVTNCFLSRYAHAFCSDRSERSCHCAFQPLCQRNKMRTSEPNVGLSNDATF